MWVAYRVQRQMFQLWTTLIRLSLMLSKIRPKIHYIEQPWRCFIAIYSSHPGPNAIPAITSRNAPAVLSWTSDTRSQSRPAINKLCICRYNPTAVVWRSPSLLAKVQRVINSVDVPQDARKAPPAGPFWRHTSSPLTRGMHTLLLKKLCRSFKLVTSFAQAKLARNLAGWTLSSTNCCHSRLSNEKLFVVKWSTIYGAVHVHGLYVKTN